MPSGRDSANDRFGLAPRQARSAADPGRAGGLRAASAPRAGSAKPLWSSRSGLAMPSDEIDAWVERARAGDRLAFDALCGAHFERVYALLFRLVSNHEDAEDLAQECFVRAWGALATFQAGDFAAWLARIAIHLARDHHRARGRRPASADLLAIAAPSETSPRPSDEALDRELRHTLQRAVAALPFALRAAFVLRVLEARDYAAIATALGVTPATARTQVMKARRRLAQQLAPWLEGRSA